MIEEHMIYKTIEEWNERNPNHIGPLPIEVCRQIWGTKDTLAQPEQEPVAYLSNKRQRINIEIKPQTFVDISTVTDWEMPLYMKPPQRTWVGLTDREMMDAIGLDDTPMEMGRKIEQALKEKNT